MVEIRLVTWREHSADLLQVRKTVFIEEQSVPEELEIDGEDPFAYHWLLLSDNQPVGCARMLPDGHIGRFALLPQFRGHGLGRLLLGTVLKDAAAHGFSNVYLHAQTHALGFYQQAGFIAEGEAFMDAGIPHKLMQKQLGNETSSRRLGETSGRFAVHDIGAVSLELARQCQRQLRLFSQFLEPEWFDRPELAEALSALARRHRFTEIRLLIIDSRPLVGRGHSLLNLSRRLPTSIQLKRAQVEPRELKELMLIADDRGVLRWDMREPERAWADFNNLPMARDSAAQFDELWYRAVDDPELRTLHI